MPRTVLLDIDGTLLDSNDAHAQAFVLAFAERGVLTTYDSVRALVGMGADKLIPAIAGFAVDSEAGSAVAARKKELFNDRFLAGLHPFPGARALVGRLRDEGWAPVVATSAGSDEAEDLLGQAGLRDVLPVRASASDADASKPEPDIVEAALWKAGARAEEAILLGDTPYDVAAGTRAGVRVVAVRSGGWSDANLHGAVAVYDDIAQILQRWPGTPFATA